MKAQKLSATLTLGLIVAAGAIAKFLPATISISRAAIVFAIVLGVAFASGAIAFDDKRAGRIGVKSAPKIGTFFTLRLPLGAQAAATS
jgi:hypothetical protein